MGRSLALVWIACGSACADRNGAEEEPRLEFLDYSRECFDSCGVTSAKQSLWIEIVAGARAVHGPAEWMAAADSRRVVASVDVALAAGESMTIELAEESESSCSTSDEGPREVAVFIQLAGELFELTGDGYSGAGWGEC